MRDRDLWQRIQNQPVKLGKLGQDAELFLVAHFNCSTQAATELTLEYRRFIFLVAVAGQVIAPSRAVDDVWHLHLQKAAEWQAFCKKAVGRELRHLPGRPSPDRDPAYRATLDLYQERFGHQAPRRFWPRPGIGRLRTVLGLAILVVAVALWRMLGANGTSALVGALVGIALYILLNYLIGSFVLRRKGGDEHVVAYIGCGALASDRLGSYWDGDGGDGGGCGGGGD